MDYIDEIVSEISQVLTQYRAEVPGGRARWPESIKKRVLGLKEHGLNFKEISVRTGIPYFTVLRWRDEKKPGFDLVNVVDRPRRGRPPKVATIPEKVVSAATATVTVITPKGIRIEGITEALLLELIGRLEGGQ